MSRLRRFFEPGQTCFLTIVVAHRQPILIDNSDLLARAFRTIKRKRNFKVLGWVVMPEHIHALIEVPDGDVSSVVAGFKLSFSLLYNRRAGLSGPVWQHRFYDHVLRSEEDIEDYISYIHFNPVKRRLAMSPTGWKLSSARRKRISK